MTTYKEIFGKYVKNYSSDPTADIEGQIWYNTTSGTFKTNLNAGAVWSAGGNMGTARNVLAGAGTQTAGLAFGGNPVPTNGNNLWVVLKLNTSSNLGTAVKIDSSGYITAKQNVNTNSC